MPPEKTVEETKPDTTSDVAKDSLNVDIDGENKSYSKQDIVNMVKQQASATKKNQELSSVMKTVEKFNTDPETFAKEAEASFGIIYDLQKKGVLDDNGELITKREEEEEKKDTWINSPVSPQARDLDSSNTIEKALGPLREQMDSLQKNQNSVMRYALDQEITKQYPDLSKTDKDQVFDLSKADTSKSLWQHAKDMDEYRIKRDSDQRVKYAKEFGVNLDTFDENKLNQQDAEGGGLAMFKGKKISFKRGKDSLSPKQAMMRDFKVNPVS